MSLQLYWKTLLRSVVTAIGLLISVQHASTQDAALSQRPKPEVSVALVAGYGFHNGSFRSLPPVENCCTGFESSGGFTTGANVALSVPISNGSLRVITRLGYQYFSAGFTSTSVEKAYGGTVVSVDARIRHDLDLSWNIATLGFGVEYALSKRLWLGGWLDGLYVLRGGYEQLETLESPSDVTYQDGLTVRDDRSGALEDYTSIFGGVVGQVRYRIIDGSQQGFSGIDLVCRYMIPLGGLYQRDMQWQESSIEYKLRYIVGGVSITF